MTELELPMRPSAEAEPKPGGLSDRGVELSTSGATLDKFKTILGNAYDPETNPRGIINIGTAENYIMLQEAADFVVKNMEKAIPSAKDFSYGDGPWGSPRLREAMAKHINRHFNPKKPIDANRLLFASGITSICEMLGFTLFDEQDCVLLSKPIYQAFKSDFGAKAKVGCVYTDFHGIDQFTPAAVAKYEDTIQANEANGTRVRALIICHPHNPLGRCYTPETLVGLMQLCNRYRIHLIVDEIYALSVYETNERKAIPFQSVLTLDVNQYIDPTYLHLLYGMSKDLAGGGLRIGCIYTHNDMLLRAMSVISPFHWPSSCSERIAALMLEDETWIDAFLDKSRKRLAAQSFMVKEILSENSIEYYQGTNAGLFIWINLFPHISKGSFASNHFREGWLHEDAMTMELIENGVYLTNGKEMNAEEPGWYRLVFAQDEKCVRTGLKRIMEVVHAERARRSTT